MGKCRCFRTSPCQPAAQAREPITPFASSYVVPPLTPLSPVLGGIGIYTSAEKAELEHLLWLRKSAKCLFTLFLIHASDPKTTCVDTNDSGERGWGEGEDSPPHPNPSPPSTGERGVGGSY